MAKATKSFEESVGRLEEIVRTLENGMATLDESLKLYEEGIALVRLCNEKLDSAEKKIKVLTERSDGEVEEKELDGENE
ncbi:MAG: exodeoxyribonuclease VII small subunit [Ruminococcaceae bacterium]|nr:exodeoxyribonuclease VII small subunit [Oscillospiraceae bacterium]